MMMLKMSAEVELEVQGCKRKKNGREEFNLLAYKSILITGGKDIQKTRYMSQNSNIILPEFFYYVLQLIGNEQNLLKEFVIDCLTGKNDTVGYMHFKVADILPIQNLVENLIWSIWNKQPNKRSMNQITMGLLFLQLINHMDRMEANEANLDQKLIIDVLGYIEEHYRDGELTQLANMLHYDAYWLSKEIKKQTGKNYTELVQTKRLNQAAYLLENTAMSVLEIGMAVGYDNQSYFHRIFQKRFGMTPKKYRDANSK